MATTVAKLQQIRPDLIRKNPDNPRLIFREDEMNQLLESIRAGGIRVPLSLYKDDNHFILIDGERRWRCAKRLNLETVPAIVQPKPSRLENLLMMFNIHNVRVDWDPMPMALKLRDVQQLLERQAQPSTPRDLSAITGIPLSSVRRALDLLGLPARYQKMLLEEAQKPRSQQRITPDLFIEIYKSLRTIERYTPDVLNKVTRAEYVDSMVRKYLEGIVKNVVHYRNISKIARAERAGESRNSAVRALTKLTKDTEYGIEDAFEVTVSRAYSRRDLVTRSSGLAERLAALPSDAINDELRIALVRLRKVITDKLDR